MPRRNFYLLFLVTLVGVACAIQADREGRLLTYAMRQIDQRHLEEVDRQDLFEGAMQGMVAKLKREYADEHTDYFPPEAAKLFNEDLDQRFAGVGMRVAKPAKSDKITVVTPLFDSPAYRAGILAGDVILKIDGHGTQDMTLEQAVELMHGEVGTPVTLSILHKSETKPVDITIERAIIKVDTVLGDHRNPDGSWEFKLAEDERIGYIRISTVADGTDDELREAIDRLLEEGMQGLIIDLRFNAGGYLGEAIAICDMFVDSGKIVSTKGRDRKPRNEFWATPGKKYSGFPIAVLINEYSASAAEIIAACLQDHECAVVVGQRSYGKGTVQEVLYLDGNRGERRGLLKVTSSSYWRPSEVNINRGRGAKEDDDWGVRPNKGYEVIVEGEDRERLKRSHQRREMGVEPKAPAEDDEQEKQQDEPKAEPAGDSKPSSDKAPEEPDESKEAQEKKEPEDDEAFFDPQLDAAIEYIQKQLAGEDEKGR